MKALKQQYLRTGQLTAERLIAAQERTHLQMYMALQQLRAARKACKVHSRVWAGEGARQAARVSCARVRARASCMASM